MEPILIAEDEAPIRDLIRLTLEGAGYDCVCAADGDEAADRRVTCRCAEVRLTPREFALLELLMRNRGTVLYRDVLYERVWNADQECDTRTLDLHIQRLRKKLGWRRQIRTVFRVGYELQRAEDLPAGETQP